MFRCSFSRFAVFVTLFKFVFKFVFLPLRLVSRCAMNDIGPLARCLSRPRFKVFFSAYELFSQCAVVPLICVSRVLFCVSRPALAPQAGVAVR